MLVFRENRVAVSTHLLARTLAEKIAAPDCEATLDALLRAGELECALADAGSPAAAQVAHVTDALSASVVNGRKHGPAALAGCLGALEIPPTVKISPPEGFAYYALHPLQYAQLAASFAQNSTRAAVIGIRSIGTTLGAVVAAAFSGCGVPAQRISVRPTGHPFDRTTRLSLQELSWIERERDRDADFFVVDEGPGLSGSSFLSVGEALLRAGVQRSNIKFFCSHQPNTALLRAHNCPERWSRFHAYAIGENSHAPSDGRIEVSAGKWRELLYPDRAQWPGSWTQMERVKFLSADKKVLLKFEGLGRYGAEVLGRARAIADAGFAPDPDQLSDGFAAYPWIQGARGNASHVTEPLLSRLAEYCAFRARYFRANPCDPQANLAEMVRCNVREEFGSEPDLNDGLTGCEAPVVVDGRMQPQEWICSDRRVWLKVDGGSHGDDHFYPGPADIAWDLAGAIVEWRLDSDATEYFLTRYRAASGDDPGSLLPSFLLAYSAFRLGYCKMAAESVQDEQERARLSRDYQHYRRLVGAWLGRNDRAASGVAKRRENVAHGASRG